MTTNIPAPHELVAELPHKDPDPAANAQARVRAREGEQTRGGGHAHPMAAAVVPRVLAGSSPWFEQPPSLAAAWDLHVKSAQYFEFGPLKWTRYGWALIHMPIAAAAYLVAWGTRSLPVGLALVGLIVAGVILL